MADTAMTLFDNGNALISQDLFKSLMEMTKNLGGGGTFSSRRISLRGSKFRMMDGGEQIMVAKGSEIDIIIVNAAKISRTYYEGVYDSENPEPPVCWSHDTQTPADEVPVEQRKSARCVDCPMNVKGSGQRDTRACRFQQRLAIMLPGGKGEVYQLQLPATSLFGEAVNGHRPMGAYAKFLASQNAPAIAIVTTMYFDENSDMPKVFFKAKRPLTDEELQLAIKARDSVEAMNAITLTVSQTDRVQQSKSSRKSEPSQPAVSAKTQKQEVPDEDADVAEPKKRSTPKAAAGAGKTAELNDLISQWDDE